MHTLRATVTFPKGYIAHPYWPEQEKVINITKQSGMNRARSEEKRNKTLRDWLGAHALTIDDFEELQRKAARPFYTAADLNGDASAAEHAAPEIVIPQHQLYGMLVQAADLSSSAMRVAVPEQIRTVLHVSHIFTGKTQADGIWDRFVTPKAGPGQKLSNQRALRSNPYLGPFKAPLTVQFADLDPKKVRDFFGFAGREIGVGASRKLGWGRMVLEWD